MELSWHSLLLKLLFLLEFIFGRAAGQSAPEADDLPLLAVDNLSDVTARRKGACNLNLNYSWRGCS